MVGEINAHPGEITPQKEISEREPVLLVGDKGVLLEITQKCYTNCSWCYKCENVSPKGEHVPLEKVKERIDWIKKFTNADEITLLGGEPLLHPQFKEIAEYVVAQGLTLDMITSGKISKKVPHEVENEAYVWELWRQGKIYFSLSFQPGRNNAEYKSWVKRIIENVPKRKENLEKERERLASSADDESKRRTKEIDSILARNVIVTTATLDKVFTEDKERFAAMCRYLLGDCFGMNLENTTIKEEKIDVYIGKAFEALKKHYLPFDQSEFFAEVLNCSAPVTWQVRFWGADRIIPVAWEIANGKKFMTSSVAKARGLDDNQVVCPAMMSKFSTDAKTVTLGTITVRTDGETTFSTPACISAKSGLCNTDVHQDRESLFTTVSDRLQESRDFIIEAKRKEAGDDPLKMCKVDNDYPDTNEGHQKICPSCPVQVSCNFCHVREADWQK